MFETILSELKPELTRAGYSHTGGYHEVWSAEKLLH